MTDLEVMRRLVFLLISVWSVLGVQTMTGATDCVRDLDSSELGELSFLEETANLVYSIECETQGIWINKPIPYESSSVVCKDQIAVLGGNTSFFCQFKYGNSGVFLPQQSWRKLNQTYGGFQLVDFYEIPDTEFSHGSRTEDENSTQTHNCPVKPTKILSTWLNITNVTEEALGRYQVHCKIPGYLTKVNLTLSLATREGPVVKVTDKTSVVVVVMTMIIILSLFVLSWKRYGTDVKLWYHVHRATLETKGQDKSFVDNILRPSLKDQYKLFIQERDATFGSAVTTPTSTASTRQ